MSDRTQTFPVELERGEINQIARLALADDRDWLAGKVEAALRQQPEQGETPSLVLSDEEAQRVVVDFLTDWRFCPVSTASNPSRSCLEDAAKQLVAALRNLASQEHRGEECPTCGSEDFCAATKCANPWHGASPEQVALARVQDNPALLADLLRAVDPFTTDGGVSCGSDEADHLVDAYERITDGRVPEPSTGEGEQEQVWQALFCPEHGATTKGVEGDLCGTAIGSGQKYCTEQLMAVEIRPFSAALRFDDPPSTGEAARLREKERNDLKAERDSHWRKLEQVHVALEDMAQSVYPPAAQDARDLLAALDDEPAPSDSQGGQERCQSCGRPGAYFNAGGDVEWLCGFGTGRHPNAVKGDSDCASASTQGEGEGDETPRDIELDRDELRAGARNIRQGEGGDEEDWLEEATTHELKCWAPYFEEVQSGRKSFEVRRNDRAFKVGDLLKLRETDPETSAYTGRECERCVSYKFGFPTVNEAFGLHPEFVVLALAPPAAVPSEHSALEEKVAQVETAYRSQKNRADGLWEKVQLREYELEGERCRAKTALEELAAGFDRAAENYQREYARTKQAEKDDHASGKLPAGETYIATWNYYEGRAKANEYAARLCREKAAALKGNPDAR